MTTSSHTPSARRFSPIRFVGYALLLLLALIVAIALLWDKLPYQSEATNRIKAMLEGRGLKVMSLQVESLGTSLVIIKDIILGETHPLQAERIAASYNFGGIRQGKLDSLTILHPSLTVYQQDSRWLVGGLEPMMPASTGNTGIRIPLNPDTFAIVPDLMSIETGSLQLLGENYKATLPFSARLLKGDTISAELESTGATFEKQPYTVSTGAIRFNPTLNTAKKRWEGKFTADAITLGGLEMPPPPLNLDGTFSATAEAATLTFTLQDPSKSIRAAGALKVPASNPANAALTLKSVTYPWGGGTLSAEKVTIPLSGKKPIHVALKVKDVELTHLMSTLAQGKVSGTGKVNGVFPITYYPDGKITLAEGTAEAESEGVLAMSPDIIPATEQKQMASVKTLLENFHYNSLKIRLSLDKEERSAILLTIEGNNPEAFGGKPVKLNVNVTGDIVPLLRQSLIPMADAKELLKTKETE